MACRRVRADYRPEDAWNAMVGVVILASGFASDRARRSRPEIREIVSIVDPTT